MFGAGLDHLLAVFLGDSTHHCGKDGCRSARLRRRSASVTDPRQQWIQQDQPRAFEADIPAIEDSSVCDSTTGAGGVNPPPGALFYPSTRLRISTGLPRQNFARAVRARPV